MEGNMLYEPYVKDVALENIFFLLIRLAVEIYILKNVFFFLFIFTFKIFS